MQRRHRPMQGNGAKATVAKVPSDAGEALRSPLMGLFEKRRAKKFFEFLQNWRDEDPATHQGVLPDALCCDDTNIDARE